MISFVLLNWNSGAYLDRCVDSLRQQTSQEYELILVDNGSDNGSIDELRRARNEGLARTLIELPDNRGFAAGMNAGIDEAAGELIVPLNSDVVLGTNFVEAVLKTARSEPTDSHTGMWAVPTYWWRWGNGLDVLSDELYTVGVSLVRRLSISGWHPALEDDDTLFGPEGTAPIISRAAIKAAIAARGHVFNESYGSYFEDVDLFLALRSLGFSCGVCLDTAIWHVGSASTGGDMAWNSQPPAIQRMKQVNRLRTYARLGLAAKSLRVLPWIMVEDLYRLAAIRPFRQALRSCADGYRSLGALRRSRGYDNASVRFAGGAFSRTGRMRMNGGLPPLDHDLSAIRPTQGAE